MTSQSRVFCLNLQTSVSQTGCCDTFVCRQNSPGSGQNFYWKMINVIPLLIAIWNLINQGHFDQVHKTNDSIFSDHIKQSQVNLVLLLQPVYFVFVIYFVCHKKKLELKGVAALKRLRTTALDHGDFPNLIKSMY